MTAATSPSNDRQNRPSAGLLWFVLIGGGVAWFARFLLVWLIAEFGCVAGAIEIAGIANPVVLVVLVSLPFLLVGAFAVVMGRRSLRSLPPRDAEDPQALSSARFMLRTGMWTSAIFVFIMLVETVPVFFFLDECRSFTAL